VRQDLLLSERSDRRASVGDPVYRWTVPQQALFDSPYKLTVWWGANGLGKSVAAAELAKRALAGQLHWQTPGPHTVMLLGKTWMQLAQTLGYFWDQVPHHWFKERVRFEAGQLKGQRMPIFDVVAGPGAGGKLILAVFNAENVAGPRAHVVITDEPLPEDVHNELWPRLFGRNGRMYVVFTPAMSTARKVDYLWKLVDDESKPFIGEIQTVLTLDAVTPRGGLLERPWTTQEAIDQLEQGVSGKVADMRMGRSRHPNAEGVYFDAWHDGLVSDGAELEQLGGLVPPGSLLGVGLDWGSKPGATRAVLQAAGGRRMDPELWVLDEYKSSRESRRDQDADARGVVDMLARHGLTLEHVDLWVGDRPHGGDRFGGMKSIHRFQKSLARTQGVDVSKEGWKSKLPRPLQNMLQPRKYDGSVYDNCDELHRLMVGAHPRLMVHPRCAHLIDNIEKWEGGKLDPAKDGIDAWRYGAIPLLKGQTS
jgi:hypothetical protein